jgi:hypothetical protein
LEFGITTFSPVVGGAIPFLLLLSAFLFSLENASICEGFILLALCFGDGDVSLDFTIKLSLLLPQSCTTSLNLISVRPLKLRETDQRKVVRARFHRHGERGFPGAVTVSDMVVVFGGKADWTSRATIAWILVGLVARVAKGFPGIFSELDRCESVQGVLVQLDQVFDSRVTL